METYEVLILLVFRQFPACREEGVYCYALCEVCEPCAFIHMRCWEPFFSPFYQRHCIFNWERLVAYFCLVCAWLYILQYFTTLVLEAQCSPRFSAFPAFRHSDRIIFLKTGKTLNCVSLASWTPLLNSSSKSFNHNRIVILHIPVFFSAFITRVSLRDTPLFLGFAFMF